MTTNQRIGLAVLIVVFDLVLVVIPAAAIFAAYVLLVRPPEFREFVNKLYADDDGPPPA